MTDNVISNIRPLYFLSRFYGYNAYYLPASRLAGHPQVNKSAILLYMITVGCFMMTTFLNTKHNVGTVNGSLVISVTIKVTFSSLALIVLITSLMDIFNRHRIWKLLTDSDDFDQEVCVRVRLTGSNSMKPISDEESWSEDLWRSSCDIHEFGGD